VALPPVRVALRAPVPGLPVGSLGPALAPAPTRPGACGSRRYPLAPASDDGGRGAVRAARDHGSFSSSADPPASSASPQRSPHEEVLLLEDLELALLAHGVGDHVPIELAERVLALRAQRAMLAASLGLDDAL
jgi:hypothetical protein